MSKVPTLGSFKSKALLIDLEPTTYNTRFRPSALQQVADKINNDGLPTLLVHDSSKLPVGAWYEAEVTNGTVVTKFFIPKEISEYDDIKARVESGILDSVSIGFNAGTHGCSICGNDIQDYENCPHIPGKVYEVKDPQSGASLGEETCYVMLDDIKASEASLVHSGAVPAAKIIESSSKEDYFTTNKLNFAENFKVETVQSGKFLYDDSINNPEGEEMKEEYDALTTKHQELSDKYVTSREDNVTLRESNLEFKEKADGYDAAVEAKTTAEESLVAAETKYSDVIAGLVAKVEVLAAPFDADYKAPTELDAIYTDLDKYLEQAKTLPSGQQSQKTELTFTESDSVYKV